VIEVEHLSKQFGPIVAVDDITFKVGKGEIVGLLGPNGAGKTTTMRMLTCFLPATAGSASVAGCDVFRNSIGVRKNVGYMPENNPLYTDMRVEEYLRYRAALKSIPVWDRRKRVAACMDRCAISDVQAQIVGTLSRGYRQRVCLADALLGSPPVLILDEPTSGLDPNQIRETRTLIRDLAREHTVMISSHILPEVEMTCERVLIINRGRIVADDTPGNLSSTLSGDFVEVEVKGPAKEVRAAFEKISGVSEIADMKEGEFNWLEIRVAKDKDVRDDIFRCVVEKKWALREMHRRRASLEEVFATITTGSEKDN